LPGEIGINKDIMRRFDSTVSHHFGGAVHLPMLPLHIYGGYQILPIPYKDIYDDDKRQAVSAGFSFMMNQQFSLHGSWLKHFWELDGEEQDYSRMTFGVSLHY